MTVFQFCLDLELQIDPLLCILKTNITIPIKIVFKKKEIQNLLISPNSGFEF